MSNTQDIYYVIINYSDIPFIDFSQTLNNGIGTVRTSVDRTKALIKYQGRTTPSSIALCPSASEPYTYNQILIIMSMPEWTPIAPPSGSM
jgi:hypothetical protein